MYDQTELDAASLAGAVAQREQDAAITWDEPLSGNSFQTSCLTATAKAAIRNAPLPAPDQQALEQLVAKETLSLRSVQHIVDKRVEQLLRDREARSYRQCATHLRAQSRVVNNGMATAFKGIANHFDKWALEAEAKTRKHRK